ncbi:hypothetical protein K503DRAFT_776747 [Rhizopogon vinicolor AM-OR11-026]|uniref:Uncharacterized protein n=1 Tax=Rhizopogon vinicolor AM-OR11-026 TaxID=1314800 RepID=A0A1B7MIC3_9AGAM|nr:hypothetical protein K503DRAFT_776747 [Rhizopogon vinicolor AM-OR11-026]
MEEGDDNPYDNCFGSSQSYLIPAPSDPSQKRRMWDILSTLSVLHPPVNESMRLQERLKYCYRRLLNYPIPASANGKPTERTPKGKVGGGDENVEGAQDIDVPDCPGNIPPGAVEQNNGKDRQRQELPAGAETPLSDYPSFPVAPDNDNNRKPSKLLMSARWKDIISGKKAQAKTTYDPSSKVIEAHADSMSHASSSSHVVPPHTHTSSQVMSAQSSEPSRPFAVHDISYLAQRPHPSWARHVWNTLIPFRHRQPSNESIPLQPQSKRSFFSHRTGPQPVTVYAARPKKLYWSAPRKVQPVDQRSDAGDGNGDANAQTVQSTSAAIQTSTATVQPSTAGPHWLQHPQAQAATQPTQEEYDFRSIWENFCLAFWCIRRPVAAS